MSGYGLPVTRWLAVPADTAECARSGPGRLIGSEDLENLTDAAEQARVADAHFAGANWRLSSTRRCLNERALPLLDARLDEATSRELFSTVQHAAGAGRGRLRDPPRPQLLHHLEQR
ncbi:hypothetical protein [Streptomyces coelicoflavus]|uniref:hypothetical protein n=1 Tax=Streptomyces coelicoflavus TaxID=285562 RepID=UPI0036B383B4